MPTWFLLLLLAAPDAAAPAGVTRDWAPVLEGRREDLRVETRERLDRWSEHSRRASAPDEPLERRLAWTWAFLIDLQTQAGIARARLESIQTELSMLAAATRLPDPLCQYLAGGERSPCLKESLVRGVADLIAGLGRERRVDSLQRCTAATSQRPIWFACQAAVLGSARPCEGTEFSSFCEKIADPHPRALIGTMSRRMILLVVLLHAARSGEAPRCAGQGLPWLEQMCAAVATHDATRCPPWSDAFDPPLAYEIARAPEEVVKHVDVTLALLREPEAGRLHVFRPGAYDVTCRFDVVRAGEQTRLSARRFPAGDAPIAVESVDVPDLGVGAEIGVSCSLHLTIGPDRDPSASGPSQAPRP